MSGVAPSFDDLLDRALDLDAAAREEWLLELAREYPEAAKRVRAALAARESPDFHDFLEGPPLLARAQELAGSLIGRAVGPYVIDSELGRGGMGSVWRARRADGRYSGFVAIKFLHAAWLNATGTQRFQVECNALARLNHPNIARLLDAGILDGTQPYLLLEYVEGERIDVYCERRALGLHQRIHLMIEVLDAVAHAHANLVVHRDLKPDNILVMSSGTVKLLDFGIARLLDQGLGGSEATRAAGAMLTPLFAAPEQLENAPITTATDVYAIGLILYQLLTGVPAIEPTSSNIEIMHAVLEGRFRPPSVAAGAHGRPAGALKGDLDNVILKAIRREPGERYVSAAAFADDLKRYLAHEPVSAAKTSVFYRFGKFVRRNRAAVAGASVALLAVAIGAVTALVQAHRAEASAREALAARAHALDELSYSEATTEFLQFLLDENPARAFRAADLLARGERAVEGQFADDARLQARLLRTIGSGYGELEEADAAARVLKAARVSAVRAGDQILTAGIDCDIAETSGQNGDAKAAKALVDSAVLRLRAFPLADAKDQLAGCLYNRSDVLHELGDMSGSLASARESLGLLDPPRVGQRVLAASVSISLAGAYAGNNRFDLAIPMYERAVKEFVLAGRGDSSAAAVLFNEVAIALANAGQWREAATYYRRAIDVSDDVASIRPLPPAYESNYGKLLLDLGASEEARAHIERAVRIAEDSKEPRGMGFGHMYLGQAQCALGRLSECSAELAQARAIMQSIYPPGHEIFGTLGVLDAQLLMARGELRPAEARLDAALATFAHSGRHSSYENVALDSAAIIAAELGEPDATQRAELAVQHARGNLRGLPHSAWLGQALLSQTIVDQRMGRATAVREHAAAALAELEPTAGASALPTQRARALLEGHAAP